MAPRVDDETVDLHLRLPTGQRHGLGSGGRLIEKRCVGHIHTGEVGDHRLKVEQRFESALADLGLVRRVSRIPSRVFQHVSKHHRRHNRAGIAESDERGFHDVSISDRPQFSQRISLGSCLSQVKRSIQADGRRNGLRDELIEGADPKRRQHRANVITVWPDVAINKRHLPHRIERRRRCRRRQSRRGGRHGRNRRCGAFHVAVGHERKRHDVAEFKVTAYVGHEFGTYAVMRRGNQGKRNRPRQGRAPAAAGHDPDKHTIGRERCARSNRASAARGNSDKTTRRTGSELRRKDLTAGIVSAGATRPRNRPGKTGLDGRYRWRQF